MGLFDAIFGGSGEEKKVEKQTIPWIPLTSLEQLDLIEEKSKGKPQVIFKHSTTCGISRMVLNMFTSGYNLSEGQMDLYFLDLHSYREVSNETGYRFQVMHQSPQLLIIKNGNVVSHASHGSINEIDLQRFL